MKLKALIIYIGKWTAGGIAFSVILLGVLFWFAQTDLGKGQLAKWLASGLSRGPHVQVKIGKIDGWIPFNTRFDHITVSDMSGEWAVLRGVTLRWSPAALLRGQIRIHELSAAAIELDHLPPRSTETKGTAFKLPTWIKALPFLMLEHFSVASLTLGEGVVGERAMFTMTGHMAGSDSISGIDASFHLSRTDGPKAEAQIVAAIRGEPPMLELHGTTEEAEGGLLAAALGLRGPLKVALDGRGPLKAWRGRLTATAGSLGSLDVKIRLKAEKDYALSASGTVRVDPSFLPTRIESVLGGENRFSLAVGFQGEKRLVIHRLTVEAGHSNFLLTGEIGITNLLLKGDFTLTTQDLSLLETSVGTGLAGRLAVQGSLFGSLKNPGATLHVSLDEGRVSGLRIANLAGNLRLELLAPLSVPFPGLRVKGRGSASGLDYPALQPPLVSQIDWVIEAEVFPGVTISVNKLELTGENLALAFRGHVDTRRSLVLGDVDVEVGDIGLIAGYWTDSFRGATRLRAKLRANWESRSLSASIKGRLTELQQDFLPMISSFAPEVDYAATVEISEDKELTITGLRLAAEAAELTGTGSLHLSTKAIIGRWQLSLPQLTALSKSLRRRVGGSVEMEGKVGGSLSALTMVVKAKGENIHVRNMPFQHVSATLRASGPPLGPEGHLELVIRNQEYTVTATTKFALDREELSLSKISITAPGRTEVRGNIDLNIRNLMAKGSLQGKAEDLSPVSAVLGEHIGGSAEIKTRFVPGKVGQDILLHLKGQEVITRLGQAGKVELAAHLTDILKSPQGTAQLRVETFQRDDLMLKAIEMTTTGNGKKVAFEGHAKGRRGEGFEVQARGNFDILEKIQRIRLDVFKGHYGGYPLALTKSATVLLFSEGFAVEGVLLKLGSGRLEVSGSLMGHEVAFVATLEAFPLEALSLVGYPGFVGLAAGRLRMMGSPEHPEGSVDIQLTGVLPSAAEFRELPPVTITVHAMLRERLLRASLFIEGLAEKRAEATVQLPMILTLLPPSLSLPAKAELQGRLAGEVNLNIIPILLHMEDQKCEGHLAIDLGLGGSMDTPEVTGLAWVEKANYENIRTGTILRDVNILIKAKNHRIELEQAHAIDGETGTVSAKGWLDLVPAQGFPLQVNVNLDESMLFRRDDLTASVSGEVTLSGSLSDLIIGGKVTVGPGEIRIPDSLPPEVVELEVVEINLPVTGGRPKRVPRRTQSFRLNLDLDISLPGRVFMRGRGLDSEWRGELHISGSPHEPVISGDLSVTRGHVNLFGKRFVLTQGTLTMYGTAPHSIKLDVIGENRMGGMTVRIRLSGDLSALQVNMESEPPLPSEEVLSHLLFRRSAARISPLQALQLAQAVKALVGGSMGVFDLMGYTRDLLGVDQLAVIQSDETEGKTSVSVGKYVGEDVYVEVGKGVGTSGGKVSVELEVAPNITVESEVGTNAQPGIGLNWKWDY